MNLTPVFFIILLGGPIVWGLRNWQKYKSHSVPKRGASKATLINSAVCYALAFNFIFLLQEVFLVLGKKSLGLRSFLYHNNHTWEGAHPMASLMQGAGALAIFIVGLICLAAFLFLRHTKSILKLFFLWMAFQGLMQSIPQVMIAYVDPGTDLGEALVGYWHLDEYLLLFLAFGSVMAIAVGSVWFSGPLLGFMPIEADTGNHKVKMKYMGHIALGGALAGSLLVVPFRVPPLSQAIAPLMVYAISIPWTWSAAAMRQPMAHAPTAMNEKIYWGPIIMLALLLVFFQMVLAPGLAF